MRDLIQFYPVQFRTSIATRLQYRAGIAVFALGLAIEPVVDLAVWSRIAAESGGEVSGFSGSDFAAYFIAMMVISQATYTWVLWSFDSWVRQGTLSPFLLRPVHPIHSQIVSNLSMKLLAMVVVLPIAVALGVIFRPAFQIHGWTFVLFPVALIQAMALRLVTDWIVGLASFWTTRISAISAIYYSVLIFSAGRFAPISLLPPPLAEIAAWLPFYRMLGFPTELVTGRLTLEQSLLGIVIQASWLVAVSAAAIWVWTRGIRQYSAVGA